MKGLYTVCFFKGVKSKQDKTIVADFNNAGVGDARENYFFRGTTEGYPGNPGLQRIGVTPTSSDPLVSTIFATESESFGNGVLYIASESNLKGAEILEGNVLAGLEKEVAIGLAPAEFANRAGITISAKDVRAILKDMGYNIPERIYGKDQLNSILKDTPRLTADEINTFVNKAKNMGGNK